MPDASVDCLVTPPPFWSLRDYDSGTWDGDQTCRQPVSAPHRANDARCDACGAVWADPHYGLESTVED